MYVSDDNLLDPLLLDETEIGKFLRDRRCALCNAVLIAHHAPDRKYTVSCPEHGAMYEHTHIHRATADQVSSDRTLFGRELRPEKPRRSAEDIIKDLGF